jgi:L-cysteine/cystine lyase
MSTPSSAALLTLLLNQRRALPALQHKAYFNYGGQGPMPDSAIAAIQAAHLQLQEEGPFSSRVNQALQQAGHAMRQRWAEELQVSAAAITLTENVTVGCNIPLWGMDWREGDLILMTDCEHPGIIAAVQEICRRFQVVMDVCPVLATAQGGDPMAAIAAALQSRTRLLILSHVLWNTGQVLPLAEIVQLCHSHSPQPVWVLVDAAQSVGMLPLDLTATGVDFYAFTGHKWCCGPAGLGGVYVRPDCQAAIAPTFIGWRSITTDAQARPTGWQPSGQRYEVATSDYPLMAGLQAALDFHRQWRSPDDRYQRICTLSRILWEQLESLPTLRLITAEPPASGLVAFQILSQGSPDSDSHRQLVKDLEAEGILLRTLLHPHCVRACVHYFTLEAEVDALSDRIGQWIKTANMG